MGFNDWFRQKQRTEAYTTPDPYTIQWDPDTGLPIGLKGPPKGNFAPQYQWHAKEMAAQYNARKKRDAMAFLNQGARIAESFRPGGYAGTVGSGLYQARANLAANDTLDEPDVLAGWRDEEAFRARKRARKAGLIQLGGSILTSGLTAAGAMYGGPAGAAAGNQAGQSVTQGLQAASGASPTSPPGQNAYPLTPSADRPLMQGRQGYDQPAGPPASGIVPPGMESEVGSGRDEPMGGGDTPQSMPGSQTGAGFNPYFLAETLHYGHDDGFYDGIDLRMKDALASRMAEYGVVA